MKKLLLLLVPMILFSSIYAKDIEKPSQEKIDKKLNSLKNLYLLPLLKIIF